MTLAFFGGQMCFVAQ